MIRYNYNRQVAGLPAPFVHVSIIAGDGSGASGEFPAQLDTGADRTVLSSEAVEQLNLLPIGEISLYGLDKVVTRLPTFLIFVAIRDSPAIEIEAAAAPLEPHTLLGRDVLNHFRIVLDGPQLTLEIH